MAVASANILVGAGTLSVGGTDVGGTMNGVTLRHEVDWLDISVDQYKLKVKKVSTDIRLFVSTTLAESSLANLKTALFEGTALAVSTLSINQTAGAETQLIFVGTGPNSSTRTATFPRCIGLGSVSMPFKKGEVNVVDVEFEVLGDTTNYAAFGAIVDA